MADLHKSRHDSRGGSGAASVAHAAEQRQQRVLWDDGNKELVGLVRASCVQQLQLEPLRRC